MNEAVFEARRQARRKRIRRQRMLALLLLLTVVCTLLTLLFLRRPSGAVPEAAALPYQIAYNRTPLNRSPKEIQYIVVHDTANTDSGADSNRHYQFFNSGNRDSSADFFVDDQQALQVNDYYHYYTWHCGDGSGPHTITNQNSIGVEICINQDGNYNKAVDNAVELVKQLMQELNVDAAHVVRHYDASGKPCPGTMQEADWKKWESFHKRLTK